MAVVIDRERQDVVAAGEMLRRQGDGFRIGDRRR
jgi:hypothetical protein